MSTTPMDTPGVRILLAQPRSGAAPGTLAALRRLGGRVRIDVVHDLPGCRVQLGPRPEAGPVDLVVLDRGLGREGDAILAALRGSAPPVVVVSADGREATLLEAFRLGAADCVAAGDGLAEALPVVALEQVRRRRDERRSVHHRELEKKVDVLERYTENIVQNMNGALLVVGPDGRIRFANPTAEALLDAGPDGPRGRIVWDWFPDAPREALPLARTLAEGARFRGVETRVRRPDGQFLPVGLSCAPFADGAGANLGAVAIFQDLTEIKQLQSQVLQREKMASIGQLAAGVAHEINNPMGFIHANLVQLTEYVDDLRRVFDRVGELRKAARTGHPGEIAQATEAVDALAADVDADFVLADLGKAIRESLEGAERIRHIVQDLRAFSHQDAGESVEADLTECLDSTANIAWTMMRHEVVLTKEYQEIPRLRCRPLQLQQVFMNLLVNAYQAIESRAKHEDLRGEIRLRTLQRGDSAVIAVEDNGIGMEAHVVDRIFDPFFTTKEVGVGMGLGLSTSFNIVRKHGGRLLARSEPGRGTRFEVVLPVGADAPAD